MAVVLKLDIYETGNCKALKVIDNTGAYTTLTTTGWGTPNEDLSAVTAATLTITNPNNIVSTIDLFTHGFPTNNSNYYFPMDSTYLGDASAGVIPDGIYTFTYTVTTSTTTYTTTISKLLYCQVQCCVFSMLADIDDPDCDCQKDATDSATKAYNLLQGLKYAASCGLTETFTELLKVLNRLCTNSNCTNCTNP